MTLEQENIKSQLVMLNAKLESMKLDVDRFEADYPKTPFSEKARDAYIALENTVSELEKMAEKVLE